MKESPASQQPEATRRRQHASGRRWALWSLLLFLSLLSGLGVAGYWLGWPWVSYQWQRFEAVEIELAAIQDQRAVPEPNIAQLAREAANTSVRSGLAVRDADWNSALSALAARLDAERTESERLLAQRMDRLEDQMDRLLAVDRRAWLGHEAIFLTRLASQRLLVARDVDAALTLLEQADGLLRDTGEPRFEAVRLAIARDAAALSAVPVVDQVGIYTQLSALIDQVDLLQIQFESATPDMIDPSEAEDDWWQRSAAGWRAALAKLSDHLVVRRRSDEITQLMTPEWAALARQNGRMLLEQAQIAMLTANQKLFEQSLVRAERFVKLFAEQDEGRVESLISAIALLRTHSIAPKLPDLVETRSLLDEQVERVSKEVSTG
ncbi:MAG: uroporphyrinogen-III C-methyltransferase [Luminiphilus sp.]|nr:uroporphyrinogen-III C-methyltransferase [Luminiphilus sp.]